MAAGGVSADVRAEIERRALAIAAALAARDGPYYAEIAEGEAPAWRLVRVAPRAEERAMRFLAARRFGVYLPMFRRRWTRPHRGAAAAGVAETPMFPGYLLLDVWGAERHLRRINACPGVVGLVCRDERPVIVPDAVVADLQRIELATDPVVAAELAMLRRPRRRRAAGVAAEDGPAAAVTTPRSFLRDALDPSAAVRVGALRRALGLAEAG